MKKIFFILVFCLAGVGIYSFFNSNVYAAQCNTDCKSDNEACGHCSKIKCDENNEALCDSSCKKSGEIPCDKMPPGGYRCDFSCGCGNTGGGGSCCYGPQNTLTPGGGTPPQAPPCKCEKVEVEGNVSPGQTIKLTTYALSQDAVKTKIYKMIYHVERNGQEIAKSVPIDAIQIGKTERYYTTWNYTIPADGVGTLSYRIWTEIICAYITTIPGTSTQSSFLKMPSVSLSGLFNGLFKFFFGDIRQNMSLAENRFVLGTNTTVSPIPTLGGSGPVTVIGDCQDKTLKLCTFYPGTDIRTGCYEVFFDIRLPSP